MSRAWLGSLVGLLVFAEHARAQDQGSFQPPIYRADNRPYTAVNGVLALADHITVGGAVASFGGGFGAEPRPLTGYELSLSAFYGAGGFETGLAPAFGGAELSLDLFSLALAPTFKLRPLDPERTGFVGLTIYAGPTLGVLNSGTSNALGSVRRGALQLGASGGGVLTLHVGEWVTLLGFGGAQLLATIGVDEPTSVVVPTYGGNVSIHLAPGLSLDVGAMLSALVPSGDDERADLTIINLGLSWGDEG